MLATSPRRRQHLVPDNWPDGEEPHPWGGRTAGPVDAPRRAGPGSRRCGAGGGRGGRGRRPRRPSAWPHRSPPERRHCRWWPGHHGDSRVRRPGTAPGRAAWRTARRTAPGASRHRCHWWPGCWGGAWGGWESRAWRGPGAWPERWGAKDGGVKGGGARVTASAVHGAPTARGEPRGRRESGPCGPGRSAEGQRPARLTADTTALIEARTMFASTPTPHSTLSPIAHSMYAAAWAPAPSLRVCSL